MEGYVEKEFAGWRVGGSYSWLILTTYPPSPWWWLYSLLSLRYYNHTHAYVFSLELYKLLWGNNDWVPSNRDGMGILLH